MRRSRDYSIRLCWTVLDFSLRFCYLVSNRCSLPPSYCMEVFIENNYPDIPLFHYRWTFHSSYHLFATVNRIWTSYPSSMYKKYENLFTFLICSCQHLAISIIYRISFHPLSRFPGPKFWACSRIPYFRAVQAGAIVHCIKELHEKYGEIVRTAPDELSFIKSNAWSHIYGHGSADFPKDHLCLQQQVNGIHSILSMNDADHSCVRRLLSYGFSDKALREQEPLV